MARVSMVAWWATVSFICVAMASFIVFEVLDLDGSNLSRPANGSTLTADPPALETERLLSRTGDPSSAPGAARVTTLISPALDSVVARPTTIPPAVRPPRRIGHLHAGNDDTLRAAAPSPSDPA